MNDPNQRTTPQIGGLIGQLLLRNPRLLIAIFIAVAGFIGYLSKTDYNEITGENQRVAMTEDQEIQLGLQSSPQMANEMGGDIDPSSNPDAHKVALFGQTLVNAYKSKDSAYAKHFNFHLLNDNQTINAFALPGGQVFITKALYDRLENEAQLAGVLGHEIGHVIHRHSAQHMATDQLGQSIIGAVAAGAGGDRMATAAAQFANNMLQMKYNRNDELQSDQWGLETMQAAGYDPSQMVNVMEILKKATGGRTGNTLFATHPDPDARIIKIKETLAHIFPDGTPKNLTAGASLH